MTMKFGENICMLIIAATDKSSIVDASTIVDYKGKRIMEMVQGQQAAQLETALAHIPERENVK